MKKQANFIVKHRPTNSSISQHPSGNVGCQKYNTLRVGW